MELGNISDKAKDLKLSKAGNSLKRIDSTEKLRLDETSDRYSRLRLGKTGDGRVGSSGADDSRRNSSRIDNSKIDNSKGKNSKRCNIGTLKENSPSR